MGVTVFAFRLGKTLLDEDLHAPTFGIDHLPAETGFQRGGLVVAEE
jgi:hypothetical protein